MKLLWALVVAVLALTVWGWVSKPAEVILPVPLVEMEWVPEETPSGYASTEGTTYWYTTTAPATVYDSTFVYATEDSIYSSDHRYPQWR